MPVRTRHTDVLNDIASHWLTARIYDPHLLYYRCGCIRKRAVLLPDAFFGVRCSGVAPVPLPHESCVQFIHTLPGAIIERLLHMLVRPSKVSILVHVSLHYIPHINTMAKKRRPKSKGTKLSLGVFLRLDTPAPTSALAPPSVRLPAAQIKRKPPSDHIVLAADYKRDNPTPLEVYARQAFQGLCIECQMTFATWKLNDFADSEDKRQYAHHSFIDLGNCCCPLCRMLLRDLIICNDEEALQELWSPENQFVNTHIDIYKWSPISQTYIFLMRFENTSERQTMACFEMYSAGESRTTMPSLQLIMKNRPRQSSHKTDYELVYRL
jgi:hypothetical protein